MAAFQGTYGTGNGFTFTGYGNTATRRERALERAQGWQKPLEQQSTAFNSAMTNASNFFMQDRAFRQQDEILQKQLDAQKKASSRRSSGNKLSGIFGGLGAVASVIPGIGPGVGLALGAASKVDWGV
jgi:hypothetical protein